VRILAIAPRSVNRFWKFCSEFQERRSLKLLATY
jgi:hypothetical protein